MTKELVVKRRWPSLEGHQGIGWVTKSVLACPHDGIVMQLSDYSRYPGK